MDPEEFNNSCIAKLEALRFQDRVAVIGSGPSLGVTSKAGKSICSIEALIQRLAERCRIEAVPGEEAWFTAERAFTANPTEYYRIIKESFESLPQNFGGAYWNLVTIQFRGLVTLNYDNQLPFAFNIVNRSTNKRFNCYPSRNGNAQGIIQAPEFGCGEPILQVIHGYRDRDNPNWYQHLVLKRSDYQLHYFEPVRGQVLGTWWLNMLMTHPCVFVGTQLREPGLLQVVERLTPSVRKKVERLDHIHLMATEDLETSEQLAEQRTMGLFRKVLYHPKDLDFTGLNEVLLPFTDHGTMTPIPSLPDVPQIQPGNDLSFK